MQPIFTNDVEKLQADERKALAAYETALANVKAAEAADDRMALSNARITCSMAFGDLKDARETLRRAGEYAPIVHEGCA